LKKVLYDRPELGWMSLEGAGRHEREGGKEGGREGGGEDAPAGDPLEEEVVFDDKIHDFVDPSPLGREHVVELEGGREGVREGGREREREGGRKRKRRLARFGRS
jgi:hypothetical protein